MALAIPKIYLMRYPLLTCLFLFISLALSAQSTLELPTANYGYDSERSLLLVRLPVDGVTNPVGTLATVALDFTLVAPLANLRSDTTYAALTPTGDTVTVAFTTLPLIKIETSTEPNKDTKVPATFTYVDDGQSLSSTIGIEYRGSFSLGFPKKSFDLEFWEDAESEESTDVTFGDLREDDDWVLDALYNEPLRVNSYVAHKLWLDLHTPYYLEEEDEARAGADVLFTEIFYNGTYHGLYMLSEQVDRKQLKLKKLKDEEIRGELYKGIDSTDATLFRSQPALQITGDEEYAGWELKYPDADDTLDFSNLYDLVGFAADPSDRVFAAGVEDRFQLGNVRDYFLFINVASLADNSARNTYLARYTTDEPYFYVPWDLDAAFGNNPRGEREERTDLWIVNSLQTRLLELSPGIYNSQLCDRYDELRNGLFAPDSLMARLDREVQYLRDNGVYAREILRWGESVDVSEDQLAFTRQHTTDRMAYLDGSVCGFATPVRDPSAPASAPLSIFPNPVSEQLYVRHDLNRPTPYALFALTGQRVNTGYLGGEQDRIDVSQLPTGLYLLRVADRTVRVVVNR